MSKEGLMENAAQTTFVPSAPPTYQEAMMQAGGVGFVPPPGPHMMASQPEPMPMPMPQMSPHGMPLTNPYPVQTVPQQPPAGYAAAPPTTIVFTSLGRDRSYTMCHHCNAQVMTETTESHKCLAHFFCCILMFSCPCCCCLPYCMDSCKVVKHTCPNCHEELGTYRP
ncbi:lipopolysaccharide-induced tumor necrosis factor-alpha factor homolog [Thrips palmi]|uniref:Lipopolysaccharide-induced tumor necrosis factor-alpha factor homolog n=1 Tax=Thrips palmi TaxID=161013 RepID=A0A6P8ZHZ6_THRPL|nr:lipopolysaccharide-induced tumor necrosis factor-alpha factor homolog [Thrips palmi]